MRIVVIVLLSSAISKKNSVAIIRCTMMELFVSKKLVLGMKKGKVFLEKEVGFVTIAKVG